MHHRADRCQSYAAVAIRKWLIASVENACLTNEVEVFSFCIFCQNCYPYFPSGFINDIEYKLFHFQASRDYFALNLLSNLGNLYCLFRISDISAFIQ